MNKYKTTLGLLLVASISACSSSNTNSGSGGTGGTGGGTGGTGGGTTGGTVTLPVAAGAGTGAISESTLTKVSKAVEELTTAVDNGTVKAPTTTLTRKAEMKGYVSMAGAQANEAVIGNLTVNANFGAGTVTADASDFSEFDFSDADKPVAIDKIGITGGTLSGTGTINSTTMTSTLDGTINLKNGNAVVDSNMNGSVLDNGGTLLVRGDITGTVTDPTGTSTLDEGLFVASE